MYLLKDYVNFTIGLFIIDSNDNECILDMKSICKRMGILQLPDLYKVNASTSIFKILNENYAPFLVDFIEHYSRDHDYNTRQHDDFLLPFPRVRAVKFNFIYQGIRLWNDIKINRRQINRASLFKKGLARLTFNSY